MFTLTECRMQNAVCYVLNSVCDGRFVHYKRCSFSFSFLFIVVVVGVVVVFDSKATSFRLAACEDDIMRVLYDEPHLQCMCLFDAGSVLVSLFSHRRNRIYEHKDRHTQRASRCSVVCSIVPLHIE